MSSEAKKLATYEDLLKVPSHLIAEIIAGELITAPRPGSEHAHASSKLGRKVGVPYDDGIGGPGGWWILDEPEVHLQRDILVPDLAGWRLDLHPGIKGKRKFHTVAPDWVCEVLSPSTAGIDRVRKMPIYAREKVSHVWLIDPAEKTLEIYERNNTTWILLQSYLGAEAVRATPFDVVEFDLSTLWLPD